MTTLLDAQFGPLTLDRGDFCGVLVRDGRKIPVSLEIADTESLSQPADLFPGNLAECLSASLLRARSLEEDAVQLFVEHHIEELPSDMWRDILGEGVSLASESASACIRLLRVWGSYDGELSINLDHGLPGDATTYVVSVALASDGTIDDIAMES